MSPWVRLLEKLARVPHRCADSDRVHEAAIEMGHAATRLRACLELQDPVAATAVFFLSEK
jgi:hypothetical protein